MSNKTSNHGGRRAGAGRPSGRPNKTTAKKLYGRQLPESIQALAFRMHYFMKLHYDELAMGPHCDFERAIAYLKEAGRAAGLLAPFCHPKVGKISIQELEKQQRAEKEQQANH